jgi:hypothetical protein
MIEKLAPLFPFIILIGVWVLFMRGVKSRQSDMKDLVVEQNKIHAEIATSVARIATALESRKP